MAFGGGKVGSMGEGFEGCSFDVYKIFLMSGVRYMESFLIRCICARVSAIQSAINSSRPIR